MKRLILLILLLPSVCFARGEGKVAFPFLGRWQPTEHPVLIDDYGFQDIQNLRRSGNHLKGVKGHQVVNSGATINPTYHYIRNGFHFTKNDPDESHVLVHAVDSAGNNGQIFQNTTAIPNQGNFSGTTLFHDGSGAGLGRFSNAPGGNVVYCNGVESRIWGGTEMGIAGFLLHKDLAEDPADYWVQTYQNDSTTYVQMSGATTVYVGSNRRINQAKFYVGTANASVCAVSVYEYVYPGASWVAAGTTVDGTDTGGKSLSKTGIISWDFNTATRATFVEDGDQLAYWYKFEFPGVDAATTIYYVTVAEGQFRNIENIWDGVPSTVAACLYDKSGVSDYTDEANDDIQLTYVDLETFTTSDELIFGFAQKQRGLFLYLVNGKVNANASGVSVQQWTGSHWSGVTGLHDGTDSGGDTFAESGLIHWIPSEETGVVALEARRTYNNSAPLFYYRVTVSGNLTDDVQIYYAEGVPAQPAKDDFKDIDQYAFSIEYQGRLFLFGHKREPHKVIYSAYEQPDVFNGDDSGVLYFGTRESLTAAGVIYNVFLSTGFEQLIITKASETYRLYGSGPENWEKQKMSANVGCVAPLSFAVCEVADVLQNVKRNIATWQASHGFVMCDGATVQDIYDDIACYFDDADDRKINPDEIDDTVSWYDPDIQSVKALITSGSYAYDDWGGEDEWFDDSLNDWGIAWDESQTTHNVELEYSLKYQQWTKLQRADADGDITLQCGFQTRDTDGRIYTYGAADNGNMYRLEYGRTFDGQGIEQVVWTKDLLLDPENSMLNLTQLKRFRMLFQPKPDAAASETIAITHYGDNVITTGALNQQKLLDAVDMTDTDGRVSQTCVLGPYLKHSLKFTTTTSNVDDGMELSGFIGLFDILDRWSDD